ncbi:hypothetical protein JCM4814A_26160 [Streptomyces phaeofaciens JCM 4814]|uniref:PDZ domain-containing protein n=1 Tax=Streptomyces phaeofaciens TaxID=68254 RepID=A0A918LPY9_9ACTN|nr:hypothetical protein GCM10010226_11490 [Streptomyces phaeofaciens]
MDEGKPTKAKWWSRPRPQTPSGPAESPDGDFELARPAAAGEGENGRGDGDRDGYGHDDGDGDGDYELSRPAGTAISETGGPGAGASDGAASARSAGEAAPADRVDPAGPVPFPEVSPAGEPADPASSGPASPGPAAADAAPADQAAGHADRAHTDQAHTDQAYAAPVEPLPPAGARPKPLHDPDPYSTPPYGEPGPWAPAPPVQHPAVAAAPPAYGTDPSAPAPAPAPAPPPAYGTDPSAPAPAPAAPAPPTPAPAPPVPTDAPPAPMPPSGPVPGVATPTPTPAPPAPGEAPSGPPPSDATATPPADPWHRYDPWAPHPLAGAGSPGAPAGPAAPVGGALHQTGAAVLSEDQRRRRTRRRMAGGALVLALGSGVLGGLVGAHLERNGGLGTVELPQASAEPTGRAADSVAGIAARALPSVVTLHVSGSAESGTGTGFVLDTRGHILTNNHVVEPAEDDGEITVVFNGGQTARAEVVGRDSGYDLAVVKVSGVSGLTPLPLGNSDGVQVGDPVVAIGAPFDLEGTVTSGIISAKERPITAGGESGDGSDVSYVDALQTDAPINPGNSGGPLLDARGRVIGINSAIRSADDGSDSESGEAGSIGLGFAIPINQGKRVAEELINTGRATHPVIGITLDLEYAGDGARVGTKGSDGGAPVTPGGPGALAGIEPGDVITEVDGQRVHSGDELIVKTRAHRPGDRLELTVERDGEERTLTLVLGSADGS